jgi:hypothetical protein
MKALRSLAVSALLMFAGSGASAQVIDDDTKCEALVALTQASSPSGTKAKEAAGYIEETMRALDRLHGQRGRAEIFPQMTEDDRSSLVQTVIVRCHYRLAITVADTAIETYEAVRAEGAGLGLNMTAREPAGTRNSRTATARQAPASDTTGQYDWNEL